MQTVMWLLLLLPGAGQDAPAIFPGGGFSTKEACVQTAETLFVERKFTCMPAMTQTKIAWTVTGSNASKS